MAFLYKYELNNKIIYIGKTKRNLKERIKEHEKDLPSGCNIFYYRCNEAEMNVLEVALINKYKPEFNKDCKTKDTFTFSFSEPLWISFSLYSDSHFLKYEKENGILYAVYEKEDKLTKKKPEYCECDVDMPFEEKHDTYSVCKCSFCGNLIKNSYKDLF